MDELVRVTMGADGRLHVGRGRPGRGAWLCAGDAACLRAAVRRRAFGRALRAPVPPAALDALAAELGFGLD